MKSLNRKRAPRKGILDPRSPLLHRQYVPVDTGKVKIGCMYVPPPLVLTEDEEQIQAALLGIQPSWEQEVTRFLHKSPPWFLVLIAFFVMFLASLMKGLTS